MSKKPISFAFSGGSFRKRDPHPLFPSSSPCFSTHSMQKSPRMVPGSEASGLVAPISLRPVETTALPSQTMATTGALFRFFFRFSGFFFRGERSLKVRGRGEREREKKRPGKEGQRAG